MSQIGLYSGLYTKISDLASLIDDVTRQVKLGEHVSDSPRIRLANVLAEVSDQVSVVHSIQVLRVLLQEHRSVCDVPWGEVSDELKHGIVSPQSVERLEALASVLERERLEMVSHLRGRGR